MLVVIHASHCPPALSDRSWLQENFPSTIIIYSIFRLPCLFIINHVITNTVLPFQPVKDNKLAIKPSDRSFGIKLKEITSFTIELSP